MKIFFKNAIYDFENAQKAFVRKKFQSFLSLFGVIIAIASFIVLISVSEGSKKEMIDSLKDLGFNTIRVTLKEFSIISKDLNNISDGLSLSDFRDLQNRLSNSFIAPLYSKKSVSIFHKSSDFTTTLLGSNEEFLFIENLKVLQGRPFLKSDLKFLKKVAIVSLDIAQKYSINSGSNLIINNKNYEVVAVASIKDNLSSFVLIPFNTYPFQKSSFDNINIFTDDIFTTKQIVDLALTKNHKSLKDFEILIPRQILEQKLKTQRTFSIITFAIILMSLVSGGISVMNIMLSNINEQTREIGLRIALGATNIRIMQQYLIYTLFMVLLGGFLGSVLGYLIVFLISFLTDINILISLKSLLFAISLSLIAGAIFGIYPAKRAKNISPISALRDY